VRGTTVEQAATKATVEDDVDIGIGIPNTVTGATGDQLLEWARRADEAGFSSLATIGAVAHPGYEELTVFAAAAAVTERIRFFSNVLISPARSTAELAKQAATVDQISGGRLTLGLGVGWREADFQLTGRDFSSRGKAFDQQLRDLRTAFEGMEIVPGTRPVAPAPVQSPLPILIGGTTDATLRRIAEQDVQGWTAGGMPPDQVADWAGKIRKAWTDAGREGSPRLAALRYFGLGDEERSKDYLRYYYAFMGDETAEWIAGSAFRTPEAIQEAIAAYAETGIDELILDPTLSDPDEVKKLAEVALD
jgi:alkanesulfonate monooxygenase SsuD/methylene tetrahydromethanopterin reductase-like flavin-dependent oxidoreductase (luciferase family)